MEGKGKLKILALHTNTGSRFYRIVPQLKWMQKQGHEVMLEKHDVKHLDQLIDWSDIVVLQMVFSAELVRDIKAKGKKVIFECDDLIHKTHKLHYSYEETKGLWNQAKWIWRIWRVLRICDGFIVSTPELKKVYGWMARRTFVFPNYMELEHWLKEQKKNTSGRVRIVWSGSTSHTGDLHWVKPIIAAVLKKYPHVQFIYSGHGGVPTDDLYARFVYGEDIFEGIPKEQRESILPTSARVFPYLLASFLADIAIAPLEKNYFNKFKTQCKYLEYGINGLPGVYSKWFYTDVKHASVSTSPINGHAVMTKGATGILADTPEEWIAALSLLIESATLRVHIGENARQEVIRKYNFANHAHRWQGFVERICHGSNKPHSIKTPSPSAK